MRRIRVTFPDGHVGLGHNCLRGAFLTSLVVLGSGLDATAPLTVAFNNGATGNIDPSAQAHSSWVVLEQDYKVVARPTYDVQDV